MIIELDEAQAIDTKLTQFDLDALENTVRELSNNKFHHKHIRNVGITLEDDTITADNLIGYRIGDTIEIVGTKYNDGLRVIKRIGNNTIIVESTINDLFISESDKKAFIVKVEYPPDIALGIKEILKYKAKMVNKIGIKSESIARKSTTYFDVNSNDNTEGVPSSFYSFLNKYKKIRW